MLDASGLPENVFRSPLAPSCDGNGPVALNGSSCEPDYEFLNAGFMIGPVSSLKELLAHIVDTVTPNLVSQAKGFWDGSNIAKEVNDQDVAARFMFDNPGSVV